MFRGAPRGCIGIPPSHPTPVGPGFLEGRNHGIFSSSVPGLIAYTGSVPYKEVNSGKIEIVWFCVFVPIIPGPRQCMSQALSNNHSILPFMSQVAEMQVIWFLVSLCRAHGPGRKEISLQRLCEALFFFRRYLNAHLCLNMLSDHRRVFQEPEDILAKQRLRDLAPGLLSGLWGAFLK